MIIADVQNALQKGRTPIILTQRTDHVNLLADEALKFCPNVIRLIGTATAKGKREELDRLATISENEQFVIVATGKYVGEGFDEPRLDTLLLAAPIAWKGTLQQYTGRLHRAHEGKDNVIVYDYVDVHVKMLENMYHKRVSGYSGMGYKAMSEAEGSTEERIGSIFDNRSFQPVFESDIRNACDGLALIVFDDLVYRIPPRLHVYDFLDHWFPQHRLHSFTYLDSSPVYMKSACIYRVPGENSPFRSWEKSPFRTV